MVEAMSDWKHTHTFVLDTGERLPVRVEVRGNGPWATEQDERHLWHTAGGPLMSWMWRYASLVPDGARSGARRVVMVVPAWPDDERTWEVTIARPSDLEWTLWAFQPDICGDRPQPTYYMRIAIAPCGDEFVVLKQRKLTARSCVDVPADVSFEAARELNLAREEAKR